MLFSLDIHILISGSINKGSSIIFSMSNNSLISNISFLVI